MKRIITALDVPSLSEALRLADELDPALTRAKVGKELFTRAGPEVVRALHDRGFQVFLDLKFHDIPNTVAGALRAAVELGVWMVNVHASGGPAMLEAARNAVPACHTSAPGVNRATPGLDSGQIPAPESEDGTRLIAVTVLTSHDAASLAAVGITCTPQEQVRRLAQLAGQQGLDGVVCSAQEVTDIRTAVPRIGFLAVTPGVRPATAVANDDQRRVMTPVQAMAAGSDYLVIGRPITRAPNSRAALEQIAAELVLLD